MGEQSNAYRILLRYDRKSRHRRIKKQRRYERLAATSQFRTTSQDTITPCLVASQPCIAGRQLTLSGGRSPYLKPKKPIISGFTRTHTLASVEPISIPQRGSQFSCGLSLSCGLLPCPYHRNARVLQLALGTTSLTRGPRIQVCCPTTIPMQIEDRPD